MVNKLKVVAVRPRDWWDTVRIGKENDGRRKLQDEDREYIKQLHKQGESIHGIARIFQGICSKRTVQFVLYPERLERVKARAKEVKRWEPYNTKELRKGVMRKYRAKIRKLNNLPESRKKLID